jgi:hypothetical protein
MKMTGMAMATPWLMYTLFVLLGLLAGYAIGRRTGHQEGMVEGLAFAPLDLHRSSLEKGQCVLCGTKSEIGVNSTVEPSAVDRTNVEVVTEQEDCLGHPGDA